nr:hypothetical protein [Tanacetum cinerariifolium]
VLPFAIYKASGQGLCWEVMEGRGGSSGSGGERQKSREMLVQVMAGIQEVHSVFKRGGKTGIVWYIYIIGPCGLLRTYKVSPCWLDLGNVVERKNDIKVSNDKGNRDCLIDVLSDPNTLVEFKDNQRTNFFIDIQKTIKVDGRKDLANVGVIKVK